MVHTVDGRSSNWGDALLPPTAHDLDRLARQARMVKPERAVNPPTAVARSLRRRLTPEVRQAIISRYESGESAKTLSKEFGISRDGVRRLLRDAGATIRSQFSVTTEAVGQIIELYEGGLTIRQVAAQVGCAYGTVRCVLHENGAEVRGAPVRQRVTSPSHCPNAAHLDDQNPSSKRGLQHTASIDDGRGAEGPSERPDSLEGRR